MIYVSEDLLHQVEYLISQSKVGNHLLFDPGTVKSVFHLHGQQDISEEDAYAVEHHIEKIIEQPTLRAKKAYIKKLDARTHQLVVRTYFSIVENDLLENNSLIH